MPCSEAKLKNGEFDSESNGVIKNAQFISPLVSYLRPRQISKVLKCDVNILNQNLK